MPACLSPPQVAAARAYYGGPSDTHGRALFPGGAPYGSELTWVGRGSATQTGKLAAEAFLKYLLFPGELSSSFSWRDWRFTVDGTRRLLSAGAQYDGGDPNLRAFRSAGGKLILWQGAADNSAGIYGMLDYYQAVRDHMGGLDATRAFARMFLVPGGYHCQGGYVPYEADFLGALVNWVETGTPPDAVPAQAVLDDGKMRSRALYAYPTGTRQIGSDVNNPSAFVSAPAAGEPQDGFDWMGSRAHTRSRRNLAPSK
jgi:feruloyl esterase